MTIFKGLWGNFGLSIEVFKFTKDRVKKSLSLFEVTTFNMREVTNGNTYT